ncbi:neuromedin-U receptor 2, partial [Biomphalaria glabrata]
KLTVYLENLVTVASILIILAVSMERFWAVYYPLKTHTSGSKSKAMITMAVIWVTSAAVTSPFLITTVVDQQYHNIENQYVDVCITPTQYTWHKFYIIACFILIFAIPMILLAILYALIIFKITRETMDCKQMTQSAKNQSQQNRRQLVGMLLGIIILFFICLLPFRIMAIWIAFAADNIVVKLGVEPSLNLLYVCRLLIYVNSAGNPIIYNMVSTKFRRAFQRVIRTYCCMCKKKMVTGRGVSNGTFSHATRMTTMSHYSTVEQDTNDVSDTGDAV